MPTDLSTTKDQPVTHTPTDAWTSTIAATEIADWIRAQRSILMLTHAKPDGDALGSSVALARAINIESGTSGAASKAECWYAAPMPSWAKTIIGNTKAKAIEDHQPMPGAFDPEGILITDTGSWNQLAPFAEFLKPRLDRTTRFQPVGSSTPPPPQRFSPQPRYVVCFLVLIVRRSSRLILRCRCMSGSRPIPGGLGIPMSMGV
jgi:hypothetical protein